MQSADDSLLLREYAGNHSDEAFAALVALGYKPPEVTRLLKAADEPGLSTTEIIRRALKAAAKP